MTLAAVLGEQAARTPASPWLTYEAADGRAVTWSWAEFSARVDEAAAWLERCGLRRGDRFLLCLDNHPVMVELLFAASATGTVAVFADPRLVARELTHCLELSQSRVAVGPEGHAALAEAAAGLGVPVVAVGDPIDGAGFPQPPSGLAPAECAAPEGVVELLFTSGTTGRPKAVMLTDEALLHGAAALACGAGYTPEDAMLIALPLHHAAAQCHQLLPALVLGGRAVVAERFSASRFFGQAARHGATTSATFAAVLRMLLRRGSEADARRCGLRHVTFAQNLTPAEHAEWNRRFGIPLQQLWGMTELAGLPLMSPLDGDRRLETMGRPVGAWDVRVRADDGRDLGPGEQGELVVAVEPGATAMAGYFRDEAATRATFRDGWLHTGDVVVADADGCVTFVGRRGDLIRRAGVNFSAIEVETVIRTLAGVADVAVVGVPDEVRDERVAAYVVRSDDRLSAESVRAHCVGSLADYKRPDVVRFVDSLPRTSVGKIAKHRLEAVA